MQLAGDQVAEEARDLAVERLIEADGGAQRAPVDAPGLLAEEDLHGIAGDQVQEQGHEERDRDEAPQRPEEAADEERRHRTRRASASGYRKPKGESSKLARRVETTATVSSCHRGT